MKQIDSDKFFFWASLCAIAVPFGQVLIFNFANTLATEPTSRKEVWYNLIIIIFLRIIVFTASISMVHITCCARILNTRFEIVRNTLANVPNINEDTHRLRVLEILSQFQYLKSLFQSSFGFLICLNQIFDSLSIILVLFLFLLHVTVRGLFPFIELAVLLYIVPPLMKNAIVVWAVTKLGDQVYFKNVINLYNQ